VIWSRIGKSFRVWLRCSYGLIYENKRPKISCYCPFKILSITKKPGGKKIYNFELLHVQKYAENCGSEGLKLRTWHCRLRKNCDCGIAELQLRSNISLKVAELRLRKCFLQVVELRLRTPKKVARAHLCPAEPFENNLWAGLIRLWWHHVCQPPYCSSHPAPFFVSHQSTLHLQIVCTYVLLRSYYSINDFVLWKALFWTTTIPSIGTCLKTSVVPGVPIF
jgi:hypothetical protein